MEASDGVSGLLTVLRKLRFLLGLGDEVVDVFETLQATLRQSSVAHATADVAVRQLKSVGDHQVGHTQLVTPLVDLPVTDSHREVHRDATAQHGVLVGLTAHSLCSVPRCPLGIPEGFLCELEGLFVVLQELLGLLVEGVRAGQDPLKGHLVGANGKDPVLDDQGETTGQSRSDLSAFLHSPFDDGFRHCLGQGFLPHLHVTERVDNVAVGLVVVETAHVTGYVFQLLGAFHAKAFHLVERGLGRLVHRLGHFPQADRKVFDTTTC